MPNNEQTLVFGGESSVSVFGWVVHSLQDHLWNQSVQVCVQCCPNVKLMPIIAGKIGLEEDSRFVFLTMDTDFNKDSVYLMI